MTTRRRSPRRGRTRRTGRNVWINEDFNILLGAGTNATPLLAVAADFMTFDTTIVRVVIPTLHFHMLTDATTNTRQIRVAWQIGPTRMDSDDFQTLFVDSIGAPWMYMTGGAIKTAAIQEITITLAGGAVNAALPAIDMKAKRRFRENESTLFMISEFTKASGDTDPRLRGYSRTLVHVP